MAKQVLNKSTPSNRVDHVDQRNKINDNFTELYEGANLKTVNGESIVGTGDLEVTADIPDATLETAGKVKVRGYSGTGAPTVFSVEGSDNAYVAKEEGKSLVTDAEKSNWNGASIGSDLGLLKTTDTPPPTGTHKGDVNSAGTYTNFKTAAAVSIVFTAPELVDNFGFIYVVDNVATKSLVAKKGGAGKAEDWTARIYAVGEQSVYKRQIWEANAITDVNDIPSISEKWTLKVGVKYNVRTYNLFNKDTVQIKKTVNNTTGVITNSTTRNISDYVEIKPETFYTRQTNATLFGKAFYDASKVYISGNTGGKDFTTPENAKYVVYFVDDFPSSNFETEALYEGIEMLDYVPYYAIETTNAFGLKTEQDKLFRNKLDRIFNENIYYGNLDYTPDLNPILNQGTYEDVVLEYFKNKGSSRKFVSAPFSTTTQRFYRIQYPLGVHTFKKYFYMSMLVKCAYPSLSGSRSLLFKNELGVTVALNVEYVSTLKLKEDVYSITVCSSFPDSETKGTMETVGIGMGAFATETYPYEVYAFSYFNLNELITARNHFTDLQNQNKITKELVNDSVKNNASSYKKIEKIQEKKKWVLVGSSIEATGYLSDVAKVFGANLLDYSVGGSGSIWTDDPVIGSQIWGEPTTTSWRNSFSATYAEKIAFMTANGYEIGSDEVVRKASYDTSFMSNLDADIFMIGTLGGNDRKIPANYEISELRNRDRTCIYGALNYVLEKLFTAKPDAKVILFGQHHFMQKGREEANESQKQVAKSWCMPFLDMGRKLGFSAELITLGGRQKMLGINFLPDGTHPNAAGTKRLQDVLTILLKSNLY